MEKTAIVEDKIDNEEFSNIPFKFKATIYYDNPDEYFIYNGKAYKRNDTSTVEVDHLELTRLVLEGENITYEELLSKNQKLEFSYLDEELKKHLNLSVSTF